METHKPSEEELLMSDLSAAMIDQLITEAEGEEILSTWRQMMKDGYGD